MTFNESNSIIRFSSNLNHGLEHLNNQLVLIGDYQLESMINPINMHNHLSSYKPIYIIFSYIFIISMIGSFIHSRHFDLEVFMTNFMAGFFLIFSFFKMLDLKGFAASYSLYDIIAKRFYAYGYIYPFIELSFGLLYLLFANSIYLNVFVCLIMLISSIGVIKARLSKQLFTCACVGTFLKVPLGNITIIEDITMVFMSLIMCIMILT